MPTILSISSWVARGHVGNSAIEFPLMRRGFEVVVLPTVILAHHPGHKRDVIRNATEDILSIGREALASPTPHPVDGIIVGYIALPQQAVSIAGLVAEARTYKEGVPLLLDPIAGDGGMLYVDPAIVEEIKTHLLPMADIATPNVTELMALHDPERVDAARELSESEIVDMARSLGVPTVIVTSAPASKDGRAANIVVTSELAVRIETPRVGGHADGTGDVLACVTLGEVITGHDIVPAVATGAAVVHDVLVATMAQGGDELALVAAQKRIADPETVADVTLL